MRAEEKLDTFIFYGCLAAVIFAVAVVAALVYLAWLFVSY